MQIGRIKAHQFHTQTKATKSNYTVNHIFRQSFLENRNRWRITDKSGQTTPVFYYSVNITELQKINSWFRNIELKALPRRL